MIPISGTIRSTVKLWQLDQKWQQKKESGKIFEKETDPQTRQIMEFQQDLEKIKKSSEMSSIRAKMLAGADLAPAEVEYLERNHPDLYREYMEVKGEKESYKRQLKNCKTKEDVQRLKLSRMEGALAEAKSIINNPNIPKAKKLGLMQKLLMKVNGIEAVHKSFEESPAYASLPTDQEEAEAQKEENGGEQETELAEPQEEQKTQEEQTILEEQKEQEGDGQPPEDFKTEGGQDIAREAEAAFEEVKQEAVDYMKSNRLNGFGLEYFTNQE